MVRIPIRHSRSAKSSRQDLTGWARWRAAGSTAPTETSHLLRADDTACPGGENRGGQLVGDPDLTLGAGCGHRIDQPLGGLLLGPEKAGRPAHRQHQQAGPQYLGAGHQVVHRRDNPFEETSVAVGVGGHHVQVRTTGRRLPAPQPSPYPRQTGGR